MGAFDIAQIGENAANSVVNTGLGLMLEGHNDRRQLEQQRKLQQQQIAGQIELNKANNAMQYDMWQKTGPVGQMNQLKEAGLNPALLYGKGGGGGQTIGMQGGSVGSGEAPSGGGEILAMNGMGMQLKMMDAQIKVMESQANKNNVDAANAAGVGKDLTVAQTNSLTQGIQNQKAQELLTKTENRLKSFDADYAGQTLDKRIEGLNYTVYKTRQELDILCTNAEVARETKETTIQTAKTELLNLTLRNLLTKAQTVNVNADTNLKNSNVQVNDQQISKMANDIMVNWDSLGLEQKRVRMQEVLNNYNTDMSREAKNDVMDLIESILGYQMHREGMQQQRELHDRPQIRVVEHINH